MQHAKQLYSTADVGQSLLLNSSVAKSDKKRHGLLPARRNSPCSCQSRRTADMPVVRGILNVDRSFVTDDRADKARQKWCEAAAPLERPVSIGELQAVDLVELGFSRPGSVKLLKLCMPFATPVTLFNTHERSKSFIPGDSVGLKLRPEAMSIHFSRVQDVPSLHATAPKGAAKSPPFGDSTSVTTIATVQYYHVSRITRCRLASDERRLVVRLSGETGLLMYLAFRDRALYSVAVKLIAGRCVHREGTRSEDRVNTARERVARTQVEEQPLKLNVTRAHSARVTFAAHPTW
uniref:Uncharacterized protein n=1 Tax=Trypanosoma congolense (strain IL3000) TaxID=1068625 RepID=G0UZW2_TRYCI|nr:conserved hypothetical protein [Trypanosoma congolense IL3000]